MDLSDELARCGIVPTQTTRPPARRENPWAIVRREYPGERVVRFLDFITLEQSFRVIAPGENFFDGMTIGYPSVPNRSPEEWNAAVAEFNELFHMERAARAVCGS